MTKAPMSDRERAEALLRSLEVEMGEHDESGFALKLDGEANIAAIERAFAAERAEALRGLADGFDSRARQWAHYDVEDVSMTWSYAANAAREEAGGLAPEPAGEPDGDESWTTDAIVHADGTASLGPLRRGWDRPSCADESGAECRECGGEDCDDFDGPCTACGGTGRRMR